MINTNNASCFQVNLLSVRGLLVISVFLLLLSQLALVGFLSGDTSREYYYEFHVIIVLMVIASLQLLSMAKKLDRHESGLMFFALAYSVFHFGVVPVYLSSPESIEDLGFNIFLWYQESEIMVPAYLQALTFLVGLAASLLWPLSSKIFTTTTVESPYHRSIGRAALFAMVFFIAVWFYIVLVSGIGSYDLLLNGLHQGGLGALIGLIHTGIGISFVALININQKTRPALMIYTLWALVAFPLGLRGEVAFPAVLSLAVMNAQGKIQLRLWHITILSFLFLAISSVVAATRVSTSNEALDSTLSIARGIAELGGSIRPAYEVVNWLNTGDSWMWGETYYAPFERTFLGLFPIVERIPGELDDRLMNVLIEKRAGPFGFSIAAESFYNFGYFGCLLAGLLSGVILRIFGRISGRQHLHLISLALVFAVFIHIRQSFVSAYGAFVIALVVLTVIHLYARGKNRV